MVKTLNIFLLDYKQWGYSTTYLGNYSYPVANVNFPITFKNNYIIFSMHSGNQPVSVNELYTSHTLFKTILEAISSDNQKNSGWMMYWFAIGI